MDLQFQTHLEFELVNHPDSESHQILEEMNIENCWWDTQDQLAAGVMILPVICASKKTHLTTI